MTHPDDIRHFHEAYANRQRNADYNPEHQPGTLYSVTTYDEKHDGRTVAVVDDFGLADAWLRSNSADLHETIYHFAVVEEVRVNEMYGGFGREQYWYAWEPAERGFYPVETPECYRNLCWHGVG